MTAAAPLAEALRYAAAGLRVFPCSAAKRPLVAHWKEDASCDPATIEAWLRKWPHADLAWALPAGVVAVDIDVRHGRNGFADFARLAGLHPDDVATPQSSTPSGGRHIVYETSRAYQNKASIGGTGIDIRAEGGYVVLPLPGSGREWLRPLIGLDGVMGPLLPAPAWLDVALKKAPLTLAPRAALAKPTCDPWAQRRAQAELGRACGRIAAAPCGAQDATRHAMCFYIGGLVARGDLAYETAYAALLAAALAMPTHRDPWRNLDSRVARSLEAGMGRPLTVSETEAWVREFRARMRARRPGACHG